MTDVKYHKKKIKKRCSQISEKDYVHFTTAFLDHEYQLGDKVIWVSHRASRIRVGEKGYIVGKYPCDPTYSYCIALQDHNEKAMEPRTRNCQLYEIIPDGAGEEDVKRFAMFQAERSDNMQNIKSTNKKTRLLARTWC
jgi:hypothetical protein